MLGIMCDSGTDTPQTVINQHCIEVVPLSVSLGDKSYGDGVDVTETMVLEYMKRGLPKTSLPSCQSVKNSFLRLINRGCTEIIALNISSALSGTYNLFRLVAEEIVEEFAKIKIRVIDSLSISVGAGLLVSKAAKLAEEGADFHTIVRTLEDCLENKLLVLYSIPTLKYLKAGGRIGKVSATVAEVLNIKPVISVGKDGVYYTVAKARGMKRAVKTMIERAYRFARGYEVEMVSVATTGNQPETAGYASGLLSHIEKLQPAAIYTGKIAASMLTHTGPGLVGVALLRS